MYIEDLYCTIQTFKHCTCSISFNPFNHSQRKYEFYLQVSHLEMSLLLTVFMLRTECQNLHQCCPKEPSILAPCSLIDGFCGALPASLHCSFLQQSLISELSVSGLYSCVQTADRGSLYSVLARIQNEGHSPNRG